MKRFLSVLIIFSLVGVAAFELFKTDDVSEFFFLNHKILFNTGEQMKSQINKYDFLLIKKVEFKDLKEQDIIHYNMSGSRSTHRVVNINEDGHLITQGDNQVYPNNFRVEETDVYGKVLFVIKPWTLAIIPLLLIPAKKIKKEKGDNNIEE